MRACAAVRGVSLPILSTLEVEVMEDMDAPIHVYYILDSFYQNHKRFVRSVNYDQLHGKDVGYDSLSECEPQRKLFDETNETLPGDGIINPCGLTAWSYFNDTFTGFQVLYLARSPCLCLRRAPGWLPMRLRCQHMPGVLALPATRPFAALLPACQAGAPGSNVSLYASVVWEPAHCLQHKLGAPAGEPSGRPRSPGAVGGR